MFKDSMEDPKVLFRIFFFDSDEFVELEFDDEDFFLKRVSFYWRTLLNDGPSYKPCYSNSRPS